MARPKANELTERELEVMQVFWEHGEQSAQDVKKRMAKAGRKLAYTTVATLIKILSEKSYIEQTNEKRPFTFKPSRSFEDVSGNIVGELIEKVFGGSREQLLIRMMKQKRLSKKERQLLEAILQEGK